jgi:hypothetical protein
MKTPKFSYFKAPVTRTKPYKDISLADVYMVLSGHWFKKETERLRQITDPDANRKYKSEHFPFVTFSGTFRTRRESGLINHSNLLVLDFDKLEDVEKLKNQLLRDKHFETELLFTSPNGNGLKWVVSINVNGKYNHGDWFEAISNYLQHAYKIEVDKSGRDVSRVCFLCFDEDAFLHPRHGKMDRYWPGEIFTIERKKFYPGKWLEKPKQTYKTTQTPMDKNLTRIKYHVEVILRRIENYRIDLTCSYEDWIRLGFAFADEFGETGRSYFHRVSKFYQTYNPLETDQQYDLCLKSNRTGVTIKTFFAAARDAGVNIRV